MPRVEVVEWNGVSWRRYPDAKQRSRRVYYWGYLGKSHGFPRATRESLHRATWLHINGPIPVGYEIDHRDGNPLNNDIGNLQCITIAEHRRLEGERGSYSTAKALTHLDSVRHLAAAWHRTAEGRAWHSETSRRAMSNRKKVDCECRICGKGFKSKHAYAMYCSAMCRESGRPERAAIHELACAFCKQSFKSNKATQQFCSYGCSGRARHAARRARLQSQG